MAKATLGSVRELPIPNSASIIAATASQWLHSAQLSLFLLGNHQLGKGRDRTRARKSQGGGWDSSPTAIFFINFPSTTLHALVVDTLFFCVVSYSSFSSSCFLGSGCVRKRRAVGPGAKRKQKSFDNSIGRLIGLGSCGNILFGGEGGGWSKVATQAGHWKDKRKDLVAIPEGHTDVLFTPPVHLPSDVLRSNLCKRAGWTGSPRAHWGGKSGKR